MKDKTQAITLDQPVIYRIKVQGRMRAEWSHWFGDLQVTAAEEENGRTTTTLTGPLADQAALHGVINRIRDLNLSLLLVELVGPVSERRTEQSD